MRNSESALRSGFAITHPVSLFIRSGVVSLAISGAIAMLPDAVTIRFASHPERALVLSGTGFRAPSAWNQSLFVHVAHDVSTCVDCSQPVGPSPRPSGPWSGRRARLGTAD